MRSNLEWMARIVYEAMRTKTPRFSDVRSFLRREIDAAYDLRAVLRAVHRDDPRARDRPRISGLLESDYTRLAWPCPATLRGQTREILIDPLLGDRRRRRATQSARSCYHVKKLNGPQGFHCPTIPRAWSSTGTSISPSAPEPHDLSR